MLTRTPWHILKITDTENNSNMQFTLRPLEGTVEFSVVNYDGYLKTATFEARHVSSWQLFLLIVLHINYLSKCYNL